MAFHFACRCSRHLEYQNGDWRPPHHGTEQQLPESPCAYTRRQPSRSPRSGSRQMSPLGVRALLEPPPTEGSPCRAEDKSAILDRRSTSRTARLCSSTVRLRSELASLV